MIGRIKMNTIWKYKLHPSKIEQILELPKGFTFLSLQVMDNIPVIYVRVDPYEEKTEKFSIINITTGDNYKFEEPIKHTYMGTAIMREKNKEFYVVHYFGKKMRI